MKSLKKIFMKPQEYIPETFHRRHSIFFFSFLKEIHSLGFIRIMKKYIYA